MILKSLKLINWRSYKSQELDFDPKLNLILGENGVGKTNLVEAIYFLSLARSWRTLESNVLINQDCKDSYIGAKLAYGEFKKEIEISLTKTEKKVLINNKRIKGLTELSKCCNVILFSPSDVSLFMESPSVRRNFLDISISKKDEGYLEALRNYNSLLNQRNALLKDERIDLELLSILTSQLVLEANKISKRRYSYIEDLNKILPTVLSELIGHQVQASLKYHPYISIDENMDENAKKKFESSREADLRLLHTTVGPHKEDLDFILNGVDLALYGSQGQNRISVLALKLSPYFLIEKEEDKPIVVLDDVTSELDERTTHNLLDFVKKLSQVFITATNLKVDGASIIDVTTSIASRRD